MQRIRNSEHDELIFLVVDESTLFSIQYLDTLVGSLEKSHVNYLYDCQPLPCAPKSNSIAQGVDDAAISLGNNGNSFCLLLFDAM